MSDIDLDDQRYKKHRRILEQADKMVASGRITESEARRLRSAVDKSDLEAVIGDISLRHAATALESAVQDNTMSREEADGHLEQVRNGEHSPSLRAHLARLGSSKRSGE